MTRYYSTIESQFVMSISNKGHAYFRLGGKRITDAKDCYYKLQVSLTLTL